METNREFLDFVASIKTALLHTDKLPSDFSREDTELMFESLKKIAAAVRDEIKRVFPHEWMDDESCAACLDLQRVQDRLRAETVLRLEAIEKFNVMTQGATAN